MNKDNYIKIVDCSICGKEFNVEIRKYDGKILTDCWHNSLDLNMFDGWVYYYINNNIFNDKKKIIFKNVWYKILGYTKIQRDIVYYLHKWFHRKVNMEIWECTKCCNKKDDI